MSAETYNGWPSYETWLVALWLSNDPETQRDVEHLASAWDAVSRDQGGLLIQLADEIAAYVDDLTEIASVREHASLASDLLAASLANVEWRAVAASYTHELVSEPQLAAREQRYLTGIRR